MKQPKYQVGQQIWWATHGTKEVSIVCPDCQGDRFLTVIFKDYTTCTIPCQECKKGWEGPLGRLFFHKYVPEVKQMTISGIGIGPTKIEYKLANDSCFTYSNDSCLMYCVEEKDIFVTQKQAEEQAKELALEYSTKEKERITHKVNDYKSWAWNVNYHRSEIRRLTKSIQYHELQLNYAKTKVKETV